MTSTLFALKKYYLIFDLPMFVFPLSLPLVPLIEDLMVQEQKLFH